LTTSLVTILAAISGYILLGRANALNILSSLRYSLVMKCACCGGDMLPEKDIGNSLIYKCGECGLTDSRVKKNQGKIVDIG
jgi:hypothetical protein